MDDRAKEGDDVHIATLRRGGLVVPSSGESAVESGYDFVCGSPVEVDLIWNHFVKHREVRILKRDFGNFPGFFTFDRNISVALFGSNI